MKNDISNAFKKAKLSSLSESGLRKLIRLLREEGLAEHPKKEEGLKYGGNGWRAAPGAKKKLRQYLGREPDLE